MYFEIVSPIRDVQTIARGSRIRILRQLKKYYGGSHWKKLKGTCSVRLSDGTIREAEIHWYEAHGVGKKELKIKEFLDT